MKASVEIKFLDGKGELVEPPFDLATSYTVQITVTNRTTTAGLHPWEAMLEITLEATIDGIELIAPTILPPRLFEPDQVVIYTETFYIPRPWAGLDGRIAVRVSDPFGKLLASAKKRFAIGYEVSPEAIYEVPGKILAMQDMPYLNPDLELTEGEVVMGVEGAGRTPPAPAPPPKPKVAPTKEKVVSDIECSSTPEPKVEFQGETAFGGRLG